MNRNVTTTGRSVTILNEQCRVATVPGDGSCMLHSVAYCIFPPYITGTFEGERITKKEVVKRIREELYDRLESTYHQVLHGEYAHSGEFVEEASLPYLRKLFRSERMLGEETKVYLEHLIEKNILVVSSTGTVYKNLSYNDQWPSCVLMYYKYTDGEGKESGHYEPVSWVDRKTSKQHTLFSPTHPFVLKLTK